MSKPRAGLVLLTMALVTLSMAFAAPAFARELPAFSVETGFTGTSGRTTFETKSGTSMTCASSSIEATALAREGGTYHLTERECSALGGLSKCTTKGDSTGTVSVEGTWGFATKSATEAFLMLSTNGSSFECASTTFDLEGTLLSKITPLNSETTKYELLTKQSKGTQEFTEYTNAAGEREKGQILISTNEGALEEAGVQATESVLKTTAATKLAFVTGPTVNVNPLEVDLGLLELGRPVSQTFTYTVAAGSVAWRPYQWTYSPNYEVGSFTDRVSDTCLGRTLNATQTCTATITVEALRTRKEADNIRFRMEAWAPGVKLKARS